MAFCTAHVPRGIDFTDDPLLQARIFSYLDTQLTRLGGPNFDQLPINRPRTPVNTNERDGFGQQAIHEGVAAYSPNSLGGGCPFHVGAAGYRHVPRAGRRDGRARAAAVVRRPLQPGHAVLEQHEPGGAGPHRGRLQLRAGQVRQPEPSGSGCSATWPTSTPSCAPGWPTHLGMPAPDGSPRRTPVPPPPCRCCRQAPGPVAGRAVGVLVGAGRRRARAWRACAPRSEAAGASLYVIAPKGGTVEAERRDRSTVDRTVLTTDSVEYDALVVAGGDSAAALAADPWTAVNLGEAFRHHKTIGAWGEGSGVLDALGLTGPGIVDRRIGHQDVRQGPDHRHRVAPPLGPCPRRRPLTRREEAEHDHDRRARRRPVHP